MSVFVQPLSSVVVVIVVVIVGEGWIAVMGWHTSGHDTQNIDEHAHAHTRSGTSVTIVTIVPSGRRSESGRFSDSQDGVFKTEDIRRNR